MFPALVPVEWAGVASGRWLSVVPVAVGRSFGGENLGATIFTHAIKCVTQMTSPREKWYCQVLHDTFVLPANSAKRSPYFILILDEFELL